MPKAVGYDADAQAFITAAGITDLTQKNAINQLVLDLKGYSIWTKMKALYPFVGGTATTHKYNLKNPLDTDAAFRLVFSGGWTHSSTGALPNGTNAYANTFFLPNTFYTVNFPHLSVYCRTDTAAGAKQEIGSNNDFSLNREASLIVKFTGNVSYPIFGGLNYPSYSNLNSQGFYIANKQNSANVELFKNNSKVLNSAQLYGSSSLPVFIGARNNNGLTDRYTDRQLAFSSVGDGLTDTDSSNFYTAVQAFQVSLSRNI